MLTLQYAGLKRSDIPTFGGVYAFRDSTGKYIYVGLSKSLRARLWKHINRTGDIAQLYEHMEHSADLNRWTIDIYSAHDCIDRTKMVEHWAVRKLELRLIERHTPTCNTRSIGNLDAWLLCTALCTDGWHKCLVDTCINPDCNLCNQGYGHTPVWISTAVDGSERKAADLQGLFVAWVVRPHSLLDPAFIVPAELRYEVMKQFS